MATIRFKILNKERAFRKIQDILIPKNSKITAGVESRPHARVYEYKGKRRGGAFYTTTTDQVAAVHEYGIRTPERSFLRLSVEKFLIYDFYKITEKYNRIDFMLKALSNKLYDRIQEAFDTNGWGTWRDLSDEYMALTGRTSEHILTDTGQLRGAIYTEYAGEKTTGGTITGGHSAKRADVGKFKKDRLGYLKSLAFDVYRGEKIR